MSLMVVADGIGGGVGGEVASARVVEAFQDAVVATPHLAPRERLLKALQEANYALFDRTQASPELLGMGTTLVAALVDGRSLHWVSVGDSPLWLVRDRKIHRLNENHSFGAILGKQVETGELSVEEAARDPRRSSLLEAVRGEDIRMIDAPQLPLKLQSGDVVILASDGVETCSGEELREIVESARDSSARCVDAILEAVEKRAKPTQDNATLVVSVWKLS